jgi:hypothetical protein
LRETNIRVQGTGPLDGLVAELVGQRHSLEGRLREASTDNDNIGARRLSAHTGHRRRGLVVRAWTCPHACSRPVGPAASELSRVLVTTVHLVPLRADLEPTRRDGRLRALGGFAMLVIDKAEAPATVNGDRACVVHVEETSPAL